MGARSGDAGAGVVLGLAILTPIFTADLRHAETPAKEAIASLVLDAPLPASTKLDLAGQLGRRLVAERAKSGGKMSTQQQQQP